jgi:hypothetical protein
VDETNWLGKDPVTVSRKQDNEPSGSTNILTGSPISASGEEMIQGVNSYRNDKTLGVFYNSLKIDVSQKIHREVCEITYEEGRMTKDMTLLTTVSILTRYTDNE